MDDREEVTAPSHPELVVQLFVIAQRLADVRDGVRRLLTEFQNVCEVVACPCREPAVPDLLCDHQRLAGLVGTGTGDPADIPEDLAQLALRLEVPGVARQELELLP